MATQDESLFGHGASQGSRRRVECHGLAFTSEDERRRHFTDLLREKLRDPEFRALDGFPLGRDNDILALSDPPYYTACPNPWLVDFIVEHNQNSHARSDEYQREPFAADVSEGKNDPIYNAHSYHTKVPHKAIMRYILHYTEPGDVIFDGFCGTGMAGVAAQLCGDRKAVEALGYTVKTDGTILGDDGAVVSRIGARAAVVNDLSPAATSIAASYCLTPDVHAVIPFLRSALADFEEKCGWAYQTLDPATGQQAPVDFTVWSEVLSCPECSGDIVFWGAGIDTESGTPSALVTCPSCAVRSRKRDLIKRMDTYFDPVLKTTRQRPRFVPVEICFKRGKSQVFKSPDQADLSILSRVDSELSGVVCPAVEMMFDGDGSWGDLWRGYHTGIQYAHDFYLPRQLLAASSLWQLATLADDYYERRAWHFVLQSVMVSFTRRNRYLKNAYSQVNRGLSGTLYVGSTVSEPSPRYVLSGKLKRMSRAIPDSMRTVRVSTQSLTSVRLPTASVDYVFVDPPFGDNLPYSELNFLWEAWLGVYTNNQSEAVVSGVQNKGVNEYTELMVNSLENAYRSLKPGHWITVEFHNSKNSIWSAIQEGLGRVGFVVADVRVLDKGMRTKKQISGANSVNKDLVISAYKPREEMENEFSLEAGAEDGVWTFVRSHLRQLPVVVEQDSALEIVVERQAYLLYDRMVAFHVQRGVHVPLSAAAFYAGLDQRFPCRDGMYFMSDQVTEYDERRLKAQDVRQLELFVTGEESAIRWLRRLLADKPMSFQDVHPAFMREIAGWEKHEKPLELSDLLEQNFIRYDGAGEVPSQVHAYLSSNYREMRGLDKKDPALRVKAKDRWYVPDSRKAGDLEQLRERSLLKEFDDYATGTGKLKVFRVEAVRAGFKRAWQEHDYETIISVAERLPADVLQEDAKLLMWYDQALTRAGE